jgi:Acyl-CoA thioesterase N-terminal domain
VSEFIYQREGERYAPTQWAGSPWSRELQHGGPVCGLVAHAAEAAARETGLRVVRLSVDLCRPTPFAPLLRSAELLRRGRRLALLEVRLCHGDTVVTRATALLLAADPALASTWGQPEPPPPGPEGIEPIQFMPREYLAQVPPGFHRSVEVRLSDDELGPACWATTPLGLIAGEETSALVRAAMLSDLTFALSGRLLLRRGLAPFDPRRVALINADATLYLDRVPEGEWVAFRGGKVSDCEGVGFAEVTQLDRRGRYGRSLQALVANREG